jgi:hypothetical protein
LTSEELPGFDVNVPFFGSASANWKKKSNLGGLNIGVPGLGSLGVNWKKKGDLGLKGDIEAGA